MENHKIANIFPMISEIEFNRLKQDIKENGLIEEIELYENKILDGRNRYKACSESGIVPRFKEFEGEDALKYVISKNLHRRHLNESQRGLVASRLANLSHGGDRQSKPPIGGLLTTKQASEMLNVGLRTTERIREIEQKKPEEIQRIESGEITAGRIYGDLKREEAETPEWQRFLDVWNFKENTGDGLSNLPPEIIKNLLYYYTKENDLVSDCFAGSGLTYKISKEMKRKCVCSDINPLQPFIIKAEAGQFPEEMKGTKLLFLDPPYWDMVNYGEGWGNLTLKDFYKKFEEFAGQIKTIMRDDGYVALIMMPLDRDGNYIDLGFELYKILQKHFTIEKRICCPLSRNWGIDGRLKKAKENKKILSGSLRDLFIFKKKEIS